MTTADQGSGRGVPDPIGEASGPDLARRVAELEATVARLTRALDEHTVPAPHPADIAARWPGPLPLPDPTTGPTASTAHDPVSPVSTVSDRPTTEPTTGAPTAAAQTALDRRRLLSRAGTAAVGAVIGGAVASVAAASPAAAASATFDTSTSTPAVDATSTGTGPAVRARNDAAYTGQADQPLALEAQGFSRLNGQAAVGSSGFDSRSMLRVDAPQDLPIGLSSYGRLFGVEGNSDAYGVFGFSQATVGVAGVSYDGVGVVASGGKAGLAFWPPAAAPDPPPLQTIAHSKGELVFDKNADLWLCTADGTPGTWVKLNPPAVVAGTFVVLPAPVRVYDSRPGNPPTAVGPKTPLGTRTPRSGIAATANSSGVPTDATAAMVSATVTRTTGGSSAEPAFLSLYASGQWPGTSNLNWTTSGATIAVTTVVPLAPGGTLTAYASNPTDLVLDVLGYYR